MWTAIGCTAPTVDPQAAARCDLRRAGDCGSVRRGRAGKSGRQSVLSSAGVSCATLVTLLSSPPRRRAGCCSVAAPGRKYDASATSCVRRRSGSAPATASTAACAPKRNATPTRTEFPTYTNEPQGPERHGNRSRSLVPPRISTTRPTYRRCAWLVSIACAGWGLAPRSPWARRAAGSGGGHAEASRVGCWSVSRSRRWSWWRWRARGRP